MFSLERRAWLVIAALTCAAQGLLAGCGSCRSEPRQTQSSADAAALDETAAKPEADDRVGTVRGIVRLADGMELPSYGEDAETVAQQAQRLKSKNLPPMPDHCTPPKTEDRQPVKLGTERGLSNVLVAASDFEQTLSSVPRVREVVIEDCRLSPPVVAAQRGDKLRIRNTTDHPFMPKLPTDSFMQALIKDQSREVPLERGGVLPLACAFSSRCGRSDLIVLYHPVFSLTENNGVFEINNVPADEKVKLNAWHPLFREDVTEVQVKQGETVEVEFVLYPLDAEVPAAKVNEDAEDATAAEGADAAVEPPAASADAVRLH